MTDSEQEEHVGNWAMQLEAIRRDGQVNMLEKNTVQKIAFESDFHTLVTKIDEWSNEEYLEKATTASGIYRDMDRDGLPHVAHKQEEVWE